MLRVIGAGLSRTGTKSLRAALQTLTGTPCYHGTAVPDNPEHIGIWRKALAGTVPDWDTLLHGYESVVDMPACFFWHELAEAYPRATILLSTRDTPQEWWDSFHRTLVPLVQTGGLRHFLRVFQDRHDARITWERAQRRSPATRVELAMLHRELLDQLTPNWYEEQAAVAAYQRHNTHVRAHAAPDRLIEWRPADGWGPLCQALGVPVPDLPFPHK
jgi:Sulfotransferase domain